MGTRKYSKKSRSTKRRKRKSKISRKVRKTKAPRKLKRRRLKGGELGGELGGIGADCTKDSECKSKYCDTGSCS